MSPAEFEQLLNDVESRLDRLKALYEQWFQGLERLEPTVPRKAVERGIAALRKDQPRNTALRFRFQTLQQKWNTYNTYWQRIGRQIEEGTYRRDLMRARRRREAARAAHLRSESSAPAPELELDIDVDADGDFDVDQALDALDAAQAPKPAADPAPAPPGPAPARPAVALSPFGSAASVRPRPAAGTPTAAAGTQSAAAAGAPAAGAGTTPGARPPRKRHVSVFPPPTPVAGTTSPGRPSAPPPGARGGRVPDESRIRQIYDQYVQARATNNERTDNVRFETVAKSIRQMVPKLQKKHTGKRIDFEVVVKDGRVGLKPVARKT